MRKRQYIDIAAEQLVAVLASVLNHSAPKHAKLALALTHTDYSLHALCALISDDTPLLTDDNIKLIKQRVAVSVNQAIATRTNVMMDTDKTGRRYALENTLKRSLNLFAIENGLANAAARAAANNSPLSVKLRDGLYTMSVDSNPANIINEVKTRFNLHPGSDVSFFA